MQASLIFGVIALILAGLLYGAGAIIAWIRGGGLGPADAVNISRGVLITAERTFQPDDARGIKTARGGEWSSVQVADILRRSR
jgi:hypothetical protein